MFCDRCGSANPDGSTFCARCGARLGMPQAVAANGRVPCAQVQASDDPYDVEQPLYDPRYDDYDDYDDDPYGSDASFDPSWDPVFLEQSSGQFHGQDENRTHDQFVEPSYAPNAMSVDASGYPQDPPVYGSPYREDDPYLAQYLSQQQYRAEHGYMTPGSPGPRGKGPIPEEADGPLKEKRSLALYFILSIVTLGIYGWYATHCMARDANTLCAADGERTTGVGLYVLFTLLTFGIYSIYWLYRLAERLYQNAPAYGVHLEQNGLVILLWDTIGVLILVGPFIAMHYVFRDLDELSRVYNERYVFNWR